MTPAEYRRALAINAVGPALNTREQWLPLSVRQAVADAVLAAIEPTEAEPDHTKLLAAAEERANAAEGRAEHANDYAVRVHNLVNRIHDHARTLRPADAAVLWRAMGGPLGGPRTLTLAQQETAYRIRAAASTVVQARRWAARARAAEADLAESRGQVARVRKAIAERRAEVADYETGQPASAWSDAVTVTCNRIDDALRVFPPPAGIPVDSNGQPKEPRT